MTRVGQVESGVEPGKEYHLTVLRRGGWLGLLRDDALIFRGQVPRPAGAEAGIVAGAGWKVVETRIQRQSPVKFGPDDFMRTPQEKGEWQVQRGEWKLQSAWDDDPHGNGDRFTHANSGQNPFAWAGRPVSGGSALCTVGQPGWEDYTMTAAVRPGADGAVGLMVNMPDAGHGLLVRWSPAYDTSPTGDRVILYRVEGEQQTLLAQARGGYLPGQWYRLAVVSTLNGVQVLIDGQARITYGSATPWRGGVGLYTEGKTGAIFDDVSVYGRGLRQELLAETQQAKINDRFVTDTNGMAEWSSPKDWVFYVATPVMRVHRFDFWGDHWMTLRVTPSTRTTGQLWLVLNGTGKDDTNGYRAVLQLTENPAKLTYTLYRDTTVLDTRTGDPLTPGEEYTFRFWRTGDRVWLEQDGETVLSATDKTALAGHRPVYRTEGCFATVSDKNAMVVGRQSLDYTFAEAPVDWTESGTWEQTTRWSCAPEWSFLAGWSRSDAALWHKQRFSGDQIFETFIGLKMEYPRERQIYDARNRDLGITICGDGHNPRSGYTGIYGAPDAQGNPNRRTVLLRDGVEVAASGLTVPTRDVTHRGWFDLMLVKRGSTVEFWVEGSKALTFDDPRPIDGGMPAIWTTDNGISVARARLHYATPAQPRTTPQVYLDEPWYPEWANMNRPLTLQFSHAASTAGKPAHLTLVTRQTPDGDKAAPAVNGTTLTLTPKQEGTYWYEIEATDGENVSAPFDLTVPVFNPALGRDDAHALILFRFEEGQGNQVKDAGSGDPADLVIPPGAGARWLPGQGLTLHGSTPLMSRRSVEKLKAIATAKACTIELWVSTDTIYPPPRGTWTGCILAWEMIGQGQRNFALGQSRQNFVFAPRGGSLDGRGWNALSAANSFRTGLAHIVLTWDGTTTRYYQDGQKLAEQNVAWNTDQWLASAPLILGNQADVQLPYLGTYYLVSIQDRCLSESDVQRHYHAGPSAR